MATQKQLSKINIFPDVDTYKKNKGSISDNEISFVKGAVITESFIAEDRSYWYRVYSDGWVEQGGFIDLTSNSYGTITFAKPFENKPINGRHRFTFVVSSERTSNNGFVQVRDNLITNTKVDLHFEWDNNQNKAGCCRWFACGKGA